MAGVQADASTDAQLVVELSQRRNPDALAALYDRYGGIAYGVAVRMLNDGGAAEEVVQEAFFSAWRNAGSYVEGRGSVRTWLLTIVHNQAIDKLRRAKVRRLEDTIELAADVVDSEDVWEDVLARLEHQRISQALGTLPTDQRKTIELAYFGGYTHTEIAGLMSIPLGTVKGRLRLGLDKLRSALGEPPMGLAEC